MEQLGPIELTLSHACRIVGQPRGTQRYTTIVRADEDGLHPVWMTPT
jgi:hypothetical protein